MTQQSGKASEKTMLVTMRITVADLTKEQRREYAQGTGMRASHLPTLSDATPMELAEILADVASEDSSYQADMFAGSEVYARFMNAEVLSAEWEPPHD